MQAVVNPTEKKKRIVSAANFASWSEAGYLLFHESQPASGSFVARRPGETAAEFRFRVRAAARRHRLWHHGFWSRVSK